MQLVPNGLVGGTIDACEIYDEPTVKDLLVVAEVEFVYAPFFGVIVDADGAIVILMDRRHGGCLVL